jgi:hypothetical protein
MRPHILQGLNPKPRRSLRRNRGRINSLTEWVQRDRIAEAEAFHKKIVNPKAGVVLDVEWSTLLLEFKPH